MTTGSILFPLMALLAVASHAATYSVTNGSGSNGSGISDAAGRAYQDSGNLAFAGPGIVAIGYFPGITDAAIASSQDDAIGAFSQFGTSGTFSAPGSQDLRGLFSITASATVAGTGFADQPIYVMVGSSSSFAASCEILILKTGRFFDAALDASGAPETVTISYDNSRVLFGHAIPDLATTGSDSSSTPGWSTTFELSREQCIPEPTTALFGLIAAVALIYRRRARWC